MSNLPVPIRVPANDGRVAAFWAAVDRRGVDECWPWKQQRLPDGYGRWTMGRRSVLAHRAAFVLSGGVLTEAAPLVLHSCDNPPCCNPRHLSAGTHRANTRQAIERGRYVALRGEANGHSKLTAADVAEIRRRYVKGSSGVLAREFGVHRTLIWQIATGKVWCSP